MMDLGLRGKSVFVAAASKGLGLATALEYAREGAKVMIASRSMEQLADAQKEIQAATGQQVNIVQMDVTVPEDIVHAIQTAVAQNGGLDIVVTNAGGLMAEVSLIWKTRIGTRGLSSH